MLPAVKAGGHTPQFNSARYVILLAVDTTQTEVGDVTFKKYWYVSESWRTYLILLK